MAVAIAVEKERESVSTSGRFELLNFQWPLSDREAANELTLGQQKPIFILVLFFSSSFVFVVFIAIVALVWHRDCIEAVCSLISSPGHTPHK